MARRKVRPEDLSESQLRQLLMEKRRQARQQRLDEFQRTGRVVSLSPDAGAPALGDLEIGRTPAYEAGEGDDAPPRRKRVVDRLLLFVELAAVVGLVLVFANGLGLLRQLNQEVASVLELPTLTPTPLITAVVLPSGHTPPTDPGGAQYNEAEIPEHLRPLVQSLANLPVPTPSPEQAIRIQIPAIGVDHPIVQGDGWEELKQGVGQHIGTADPGENGNLVLSAHNDVFGEIFRHLDQLEEGDEIIIFSNIRSYTYVVTGWDVVEPTDVHVMDSTRDPTATLISCYPYLVNTERIVVKAELSEG